MSINLSKVFDLSRNVFIEACAGAGKTWLLSKRYAAIMDDFARQHAENPQLPRKDASNILVITFTRKAAAEMSGRIYADLNQLLNDQELDHVPSGFGKHLRQASKRTKMHLRSTYSKNAISTIDSFCTQILREKAEQLNIDPEFRIQDEADTQRMELETWERYLRECSRNGDEDLKYLLEQLSVFHINEYVKKLQGHAQLMTGWLEHHAGTPPEKLQAEFKAKHPLPDVIESIESALMQLVDGLPDASDMLDSSHDQYLTFKELLALLSNPREDDYGYGLELLEFVRRLALLKSRAKYIDKPSVPGKVWPEDRKDEFRSRLRAFKEKAEQLLPYETLMGRTPTVWDLEACNVQHHLAKFFLGYWDALNQRLKREGVLSFNEVIIQTRKVLQDKEVAAHYGQRFSHILFDEFQDTNDLRWDIVRLIAQGGKAQLRDRGLFIVGDTKQSIYRFNQADVQVMNRVRGQIEAGSGLSLTADETYRSSQAFVDSMINPLITTAFPEPGERENIELYETVFKATSAAKSSPLTDEERKLSRCVISAVLEDGESSGASADIYRIADLTDEWLQWVTEKKVEPKAGPSIGILLRSFTHILDYIRIFTSRGLEFEVLSSKGLFAQQESYDLYHLLSVLINPLDDLALVGLLRSPLFVMTDADIQNMRDGVEHKSSTGWVWNSLSQSHPQIIETLRDWQQDTAREPVDRLVGRILAEGDRRLGWISETGGTLRLANLERLILMIHQLSLDGLGLREIHEFFKFQIQHGDASQAELPGSARIQILTIHKAKGLEFPVVMLPDLQSPIPSEKGGIYVGRTHDEWEVGITIDTLTSSHNTWMLEKIKSQTKAEEEAEDKRLFYVAVTRARYGISFVARLNPTRKVSSNTRWDRYLTPVFNLDVDKDLAQIDPHALQADWRTRTSENIIYDLTLGSDLLRSESGETPGFGTPVHRPPPVTSRLVYEEISPHTIMTWMDQEHYEGSEERQLGDDLGLETSALTFGRLLHRAMEMEWFVPEQYAEEIEQFLDDEGIVETELQHPFLEDLSDCLDMYQASSLARKMAALPGASKLPELPVFGYLKSDLRIYKVSGIIDLLYEDGDQWVILDYKTDKEVPNLATLKDHGYWYQIQTYQWILKRLYGIEARGELYFNRFDKIIPIAYEENLYFSKLGRLEHGKGLAPVLPAEQVPPEAMQKILRRLKPEDEVIVVEPTKNSGERLAQSLASTGLNHPRLQILTLGELRKMTEPTGRRLTPYLARLGVAQVLGKRSQWGIVNRMAEAFHKATSGESVTPQKETLFQEFLEWCQNHSILIPGRDVSNYELSTSIKIIVNSIHSTSPSDYGFLADLAQKHDLIFLDPLQKGKASPGFSMSIADWMTQEEMPAQESNHSYTPCFSTYEEVVLVASQIRQLLMEGEAPHNILIAVSSMERYVPAIKRVFDQMGISVRLSKREPVMERPVSHLAFALIQGRLSRHLSWDLAMAVWLHPLVMPSGAEGYSRLRLDIEMRKMGVTHIDESLPESIEHPRLNQTAKDLLKFITEEWRDGKQLSLDASAEWLLSMLKGFQFTHRLGSATVASKAYTSLKNAIVGIQKDWQRYLGRKGSLGDLNRELKERLRGVEVASAQQGFGVDVISLLDTLNLNGGHLFVMGLTEGQFPLTADTNPYIKAPVLNPWFLNLYLFKQWLKRPVGKLHLTAPLRNADGTSLEESTFCQYLEKLTYPRLPATSQDQQYEVMAGRQFTTPDSPWQMRHNKLLMDAGQGAWHGTLAPHNQSNFEHISASAFDELIKCPQRYWYSRKLQLEPAETNISDREEIEVGNLVHKVLELFGQQDGFVLVVTDLPAGLKKLETIATDLLERKEVDLDADLLHNKWGELYFKNFQDPGRNLLAAMLSIEKSTLEAFRDPGVHEQAFGDDRDEKTWPAFLVDDGKISLSLRGKIDRVFVAGDSVWASDYKTGMIRIADTKDFWTSQMLFYYLVLKSRYPEKHVILTYEQVRAFKGNSVGIKGYIGDLDGRHPVMDTVPSRSKPLVPIGPDEDWTIERIKAETLGYAQHLADNSFPLTEREEKSACAYCDFDRICRKTALPR